MTNEYENEEEYEDEEVTSESEEEEYEDEAEDAEASDESEEDEDSVESWSYEEKKSRFSKEMIAGFAAIAVLVAIFGIVVYKKLPGSDDNTELAAGPEASLGNPESELGNPEGSLGAPDGTPPEEDPSDPFREGAPNGLVTADLGPQNEPIPGAETSNVSLGNEFGNPDSAIGDSTSLTSTDSPSEASNLFPNETSNGQGTSNELFGNDGKLGNSEPFASNSETTDLFPNQPGTGLDSTSEQPFGNSTASPSTATDEFGRPLAANEFSSGQPETTNVFPGTGSDGLADTSRPDPFGGPSQFDSSESSSGDLFPQDNQLAQNEPDIDSSLGNSPGESALTQPDLNSGATEFGSSTGTPIGNEPFSSTAESPSSNEPFGSTSGLADSQPTGLFDRDSDSSMNNGGLSDPSSTALSSEPGFGNDTLPGSEFGTPQPSTSDSEFGSLDNNLPGSDGTLDNGPSATSSTPFGSEEPFGNSDTGSTETAFGNPETASSRNDPFGATGTTSNEPFSETTSEPSTGFDTGNGFDSGSSEPTNLFPDTSQPVDTASREPFQPPITSTPESSFPDNSASPISNGGPFGNEPFDTAGTGSPAGRSTFAGQPANSGTYTVQDGDSYWNISKKVYGTAKYFQVLADHNRRTIADPQKMKAGVTIETPPASALQRKLKTVRRAAPAGLAARVEPSGRADGAGSASSSAESVVVSRPRTKPNKPSGILFNEQGYPMYRIGETDTLTSIASNHLGRASRWQQVYNMNRDQLQSPDKLQIGMLLKLPADASRVPLIDRTSSLR